MTSNSSEAPLFSENTEKLCHLHGLVRDDYVYVQGF
jgi:hypothetical protein